VIKLNGIEVDFKSFPNGETLVNGDQLSLLTDTFYINKIVFKFENDGDLIKLMFVKKYLEDKNLSASLKIFYMPYSRMDRVEGNSVFTLKYVSNFINSLDFVKVEVIEPHSNVTMALLNKSYATYPTIELLETVIQEIGFNKNEDYLFFPDVGAMGRYKNVNGFKQLVAHKVRVFGTGEITSLDVMGKVDKTGFKALIVDDLSSYGGTFIASAAKLKEMGASEIYLLVGHAEESIYKGKIFDNNSYINKVFTTDSIVSKELNDKIKIYPLGGN
jgi:ribose-phosphate pyrophosphokinase